MSRPSKVDADLADRIAELALRRMSSRQIADRLAAEGTKLSHATIARHLARSTPAQRRPASRPARAAVSKPTTLVETSKSTKPGERNVAADSFDFEGSLGTAHDELIAVLNDPKVTSSEKIRASKELRALAGELEALRLANVPPPPPKQPAEAVKAAARFREEMRRIRSAAEESAAEARKAGKPLCGACQGSLTHSAAEVSE